MGKRLKQQRRGKGSFTFKSQRKNPVKSQYVQSNGKTVEGEVLSLVKESGRSNVLSCVLFETGEKKYHVAPEGLYVGEIIHVGPDASVKTGNVLPLSTVPEGCPIFNIELTPGDGGKLVKGTGLYALMVSKDTKRAFVKMPSGKTKTFSVNSRATVGCSAGGEREEKPFVKAGNKWHKMKALGRKYQNTRGVAMNALSHPFGGEQHHAGKSKSTKRDAPPGRKVGAIASRRTGRKKK